MNADLDLRARRAASALHLSAEGVDPLASRNNLHRVKRQRARVQVAVALVVLVTLVATGVLVGHGDTPVVGPLPSLATIPVGRQPTGVAVGEGAAWVVNATQGTVSRIDPRTNQVTATIKTGGRPVHVAADTQAVWVAYPQDALVKRIDPGTNRVVASLDVAQPQGVALGFGSVWVPSQRSGRVLRIDPLTNTTRSIPAAGEQAFIAVGAEAVWVGNTDQNTVQRIDPGSDAVTATYPVDAAFDGMAVDEGSLWTVNSITDTVSRARLPK